MLDGVWGEVVFVGGIRMFLSGTDWLNLGNIASFYCTHDIKYNI